MIKADARPQIILFFLILISAFLIRLHDLGDASLSLDETASLYFSGLPLSTLWVTAYDPTPPLFYTIEKLALLFGESEFILRFPSVIFGVATIYLVYRAALETAGHTAALAASLFLTFSSGNIEYSQEARAYSLLGLCISGAFLGLIRLNAYLQGARKGTSTGDLLKHGGALYLLFTLAALYTHNIAVFFVFAAQLYLVWAWLYLPGRGSNLAAFWLVAHALVFILWLPWLVASLEILGGIDKFNWLQQASPQQAIKTILAAYAFREISAGQPLIDLFVVSLMVTGLYTLKRHPGLLVLSLATLTASTLLVWLFGFYKPVFMFRTVLWGTLITAFVIGVGVARFTPAFSYSIMFLLALLGAKNTCSYFESNRAEFAQWKEAANYVDTAGRAGDAYIFCSYYVARPYVYYANGISGTTGIYGYDRVTNGIWRGDIHMVNDKKRISWKSVKVALPDAIPGQHLWLISAHSKIKSIDYGMLVRRMLQDAGYENTDYKRFLRIEVYGFRKASQ